MNIEDDLRVVASQPSDAHKTALRRQLVTHFEAVAKPRHKKRASWLPYVLVPVGALSLLVAVNVLVPSLRPGDQPNVAQKIIEPLTSKQVFAIAMAKLQDVTELQPGEVFYERAIQTTHFYPEKNIWGTGCAVTTDISERYISADGYTMKYVRYTIDNKVFHVATNVRDDSTGSISVGDEFYYDKPLADSTYQAISCDETYKTGPSYTDATSKKKMSDLKTPVYTETSPELLGVGNDLMSGNPSAQKAALGVLQKSDGFTVETGKHIANHTGSIIALIEDGDTLGWQAYYFDESTKQFVGYENSSNLYVVLQQDIRQYKHDPQYVGPSPEGL